MRPGKTRCEAFRKFPRAKAGRSGGIVERRLSETAACWGLGVEAAWRDKREVFGRIALRSPPHARKGGLRARKRAVAVGLNRDFHHQKIASQQRR
jgi:hypothetical protein